MEASRAIMARILALHDYQVDMADGGVQALEAAREHTYQLAILDYRMPQMNGVELFEKLREVQPAIRGVFLTGYSDHARQRNAGHQRPLPLGAAPVLRDGHFAVFVRNYHCRQLADRRLKRSYPRPARHPHAEGGTKADRKVRRRLPSVHGNDGQIRAANFRTITVPLPDRGREKRLTGAKVGSAIA
jgi:CheY-like chemotaxis protein